MERYQLNNGVEIPVLGFGTWKAQDGEEAYQAVLTALEAGYRHIDTAAVYKNEGSVGSAIKDSGIPREELFITTKLWNGNHTYEETQGAFARSLERLGLDYLDLYLIHWSNPKPLREQEAWKERNREVWRAMEDLYREGKIRAIGVSNFLPHHLEPLLETARILPAVNQIRLAPGVYQAETVDYCRKHNILLEAWGPSVKGNFSAMKKSRLWPINTANLSPKSLWLGACKRASCPCPSRLRLSESRAIWTALTLPSVQQT